MRGGLDDALDKLARRDELRRRAAGEASGTPPAVNELVEAVAAVVARRPELAITMGVEGAGDPVLLHFAVDNGVVQVRADNSVAERAAESVSPAARHADFDIDPEPMDEEFPAQPTSRGYDTAQHPPGDGPTAGGTDTGDPRPYRYDAARQYEATGSYEPSPYDDPQPFDPQPFDPEPYEAEVYDPEAYEPVRYAAESYGRGASASRTADQPRYTTPVHPTPVHPAPNRSTQDQSRSDQGQDRGREDRGREDQGRQERGPQHQGPQHQGRQATGRQTPGRSVPTQAPPVERSMPAPLPEPVPLRMEPGETEVAAKRLAALLREDPSLLHPAPRD